MPAGSSGDRPKGTGASQSDGFSVGCSGGHCDL